MSASEEGNCTGGEEKDPAPSNISEEKMKVHRGGRYPHDIQLETLARSGKEQFVYHILIGCAFKVALTIIFHVMNTILRSAYHTHAIYLFYIY